jgi:glycerol-3-phosphate O-acyltransferase / dihydroxyacetone phosphate acyltransferase
VSWPAVDFADCEVRDAWFLGQDVNAWTSLVYVAVGFVMVGVVVRHGLSRAFLALAGVTVLEGVGSLLYHGGSGDVAQFLHDVPLIGALGFVAGWHVARLIPSPPTRTGVGALVGLGAGLWTGGLLWAWAPGATNVAVGTLIATIVVAELLARRARLAGVWTWPLVVALAFAVASWIAGTPDSPLCDAESWLQPHGAWHVLTALIVLAWMGRAALSEAPDTAPRLWRIAVDRVIGVIAKVLTHAFHRSVEVAGRERIPKDRPILLVANHGNGFVDPIIVTAVLGRLPRFLAKAALWKVVVARPFLALAGVLPVYRTSDGDRASDNRSVFEACHRELARGATVAIFPEGTTGDRAGLDRVRAGAARIALGAAPGAPGLVIVPIGLAFESRTETRGRALVMIGEPIEMDGRARGVAGSGVEPDREAVGELTADIAAALARISPEFATVEEREVLRAAAKVECAERPRRREPGFGEVEVLARQLASRPSESRADVVEAFRRYATQLQLIGLNDRQVDPIRISLIRLAASIAALVGLGSLVITATLVHLPAIVLVVVSTGAVRSTATKGTVRLLVGLVSGLLTWTVAGMVLADGWAAVLAGVLVAVEGAIALAVWTPLTRLIATVWGWVRSRDRVGLLGPVLVERERVVIAVRGALGTETALPAVRRV